MTQPVAEARKPRGLIQEVGYAVAAFRNVQLAVPEVAGRHEVDQQQFLRDAQVGFVAVPIAGILVPTPGVVECAG